MLRFSIYSPDSVVVVDNAIAVVSLAALPANVVVVAYQIDQGSIEYNDRPNLRTPFTDPAPYQSFLNLWITAAAAQIPALQLAQAKQVKIDLVEAIFHHKRRLPYVYKSWSYDAHDESVTNIDLQVQATATDGGLVGSINTAFATITNQINSAVVAVNNSSANAVNVWSAEHVTNFARVQLGDAPNPAATGSQYVMLTPKADPWQRSLGSGGFQSMGDIAGASVSATPGFSHVGNITLQPLNAAVPQSIPATDVSAALLGIANRRNSLNTNRLTKQIAINALPTVAAVTAYDATTGWSF